MGGNGILGVADISSELDAKAFAACDLVSLHSSQELSALSSEHGPNDELDAASWRVMSVQRRGALVSAVVTFEEVVLGGARAVFSRSLHVDGSLWEGR